MGLRNLKPKQNPPFITEVKVFKNIAQVKVTQIGSHLQYSTLIEKM